MRLRKCVQVVPRKWWWNSHQKHPGLSGIDGGRSTGFSTSMLEATVLFQQDYKMGKAPFSKPFYSHICLDQPFWFEFLEYDLMNEVELQWLCGSNCCWGAYPCSDVWWRICTERARVKSKREVGTYWMKEASELFSALHPLRSFSYHLSWKKRLP